MKNYKNINHCMKKNGLTIIKLKLNQKARN